METCLKYDDLNLFDASSFWVEGLLFFSFFLTKISFFQHLFYLLYLRLNIPVDYRANTFRVTQVTLGHFLKLVTGNYCVVLQDLNTRHILPWEWMLSAVSDFRSKFWPWLLAISEEDQSCPEHWLLGRGGSRLGV